MRRFSPFSACAATLLLLPCPSRLHADELKFPPNGTLFFLSAPLSELNADPKATLELKQWVARGGVLRVSSDAATLFGFSVVKPRERTFNRAGQRFGRATSALRLGASPLLWNTESESSLSRTDELPGVREVFYKLPSPEDMLLSDVGKAGVPLLRVEESGSPLYAAAMRSYGRGWVVFAPRRIEERADGEVFERNIHDFCEAAAHGDWQVLPAMALAEKLSWNKRLALLPDLDAQPDAKTEPEAVPDESVLPLSPGEIEAVGKVWEEAATATQDESIQKRARALTVLLRLRLSWLRGTLVTPADAAQRDANSTGRNNARIISTPAEPSPQHIPTDLPQWRQAFWETQDGGDYAPFARWWNGVLALRNCEPQTSQGVKPLLRVVSFADDAVEAQNWWKDATPTLADGTESAEEAADAIRCAEDVEDIHDDDPLLQATWTPPGGAPCSMLLSPVHAVSDQFPPDPLEWGMPDKHLQFYIFLLKDFKGEDAMPLGLVARPIMYLRSNAIRAKMIWNCSAWWSNSLPSNYGFETLPMNFVMIPKTGWHHGGETSLGGKLHKADFKFGYYTLQEARLQDNWICVPTYYNNPTPTLEALHKVRGTTSWAEPNAGVQFYRYYMETLWGMQTHAATFTPARVARLSAFLCEKRWLDGSEEGAPDWFDEGLQNLFSLDTGDFIEQNEATPQNLLLPRPLELPGIAQTSLLSDVFGEMEKAARRQSLACSDVDLSPNRGKGMLPQNGSLLEDEKTTKIMRYFYSQFGAGAVVETLQRLGAGETIDQALQHTIEMNEAELWKEALGK